MRSGEFNIFDNDDLLSLPKAEDQIVFNEFRILNIDYLIIGNFVNESSSIKAEYQVFDIRKGSKVRSSTVFGIPNKNRQLAH